MIYPGSVPYRTARVRRLACELRSAQAKLEKLSGVAAVVDLRWQAVWLKLLAHHLAQMAVAADENADQTRAKRGLQRGRYNKATP